MAQQFRPEPTTTRTLRIKKKVDTWAMRAAQKANVSVNSFLARILENAAEQRHAKD